MLHISEEISTQLYCFGVVILQVSSNWYDELTGIPTGTGKNDGDVKLKLWIKSGNNQSHQNTTKHEVSIKLAKSLCLTFFGILVTPNKNLSILIQCSVRLSVWFMRQWVPINMLAEDDSQNKNFWSALSAACNVIPSFPEGEHNKSRTELFYYMWKIISLSPNITTQQTMRKNNRKTSHLYLPRFSAW